MTNFEMVKQAAFCDMMEKAAYGSEYSVKPPLNQSVAILANATQNNIADPLNGGYMLNRDLQARGNYAAGLGALIGAPSGAALGSGVGMLAAALAKKNIMSGLAHGAVYGGLTGMLTGAGVGGYGAESNYLRERGIDRRGISGLFGHTRVTPAAYKKYKNK